MKFEFMYPSWFIIAAAVFFGIMIIAHFAEARRNKLARVFSKDVFSYSESQKIRRFIKWLLLAISITLICVSLAEPRYGIEIRTVNSKGRDIVFILDVSRSMLANDITPTRLKRAKTDIIESVRNMQGHRLGLIAFAGKPKEICPLTYDYHHFIQRLKEVDPDSIPIGGTNIGDAIRESLDLIEAGVRLGNYKDLILITDGQDLEGFYEEAAKRAGKMNVAIYTIGIGQASESSIRLADGTYLKSDGKIVKTALNPDPLREISQLSLDGSYQNLAASPRWLENILTHIANKEQIKNEEQKQERKIPRFYYFLFTALIFFGLSHLIPDRKRMEAGVT